MRGPSANCYGNKVGTVCEDASEVVCHSSVLKYWGHCNLKSQNVWTIHLFFSLFSRYFQILHLFQETKNLVLVPVKSWTALICNRVTSSGVGPCPLYQPETCPSASHLRRPWRLGSICLAILKFRPCCTDLTRHGDSLLLSYSVTKMSAIIVSAIVAASIKTLSSQEQFLTMQI